MATSKKVAFFTAGALALTALSPSTANAEQRYIESTDSFSVAGVTISETRVTGTYEVENGAATAINSHSCDVTRDYDPLAKISSEKSDAYVSNGEATFLCSVNVQRGVPTPWEHVNWSNKTQLQGVVGNGNGDVVNQGWL